MRSSSVLRTDSACAQAKHPLSALQGLHANNCDAQMSLLFLTADTGGGVVPALKGACNMPNSMCICLKPTTSDLFHQMTGVCGSLPRRITQTLKRHETRIRVVCTHGRRLVPAAPDIQSRQSVQALYGRGAKEAEGDLLLGSLSLKGFHLALPLDLQHLGFAVCALQLFLNSPQKSVSA